MTNIKKFLILISHFRNGYKPIDRINIFLHNLLYIVLYPINRAFFLLLKKNIIHPRLFFNNFKVKNSDGLFICRDNVDLEIVSENFEHSIRNYFKRFKKGVFVDIGANIGKYTIMVGNQLGGNGKVVSIEPHPDNFETLKKNIKLNGSKNVIPINAACWNKKDILKLFDHEDQPLLASTIKPSKNHIRVNADSLDNMLEKLKVKKADLVKIDVEGAESQVLEGMKNILKDGRTKVIFEAWDNNYVDSCKRVLRRYNYEIKHLDKTYWMGFHK